MPDLRTGATVLVAAHGNSLRALVKHLDGLTPEAVVELNLPTGEPLVYELDDALQPPPAVGPGGVRGRYLDPDRAVAAADAVATRPADRWRTPRPSSRAALQPADTAADNL